MKLSGDKITTANTVAVFHALATASEKARRIMRLTEDSDINPFNAASQLNAIISTLNLALAEVADPAPPVPEQLKRDITNQARYFSNGNLIWKFDGLKVPQVRGSMRPNWIRSEYDNLDDFATQSKASPAIYEISSDIGEP